MSHRFWRRAAVGVLVLSLAVVGGTAAAAPKKAKKNATLEMKGKLIVKRNKFIKDEARFSPGNVQIRSGGTLTLRNRQEQPHTFSIVKGSDVPRSTNKILNCGAPGTPATRSSRRTRLTRRAIRPCRSSMSARRGSTSRATRSILNPKQTVKVNVSAPKGTTLNFFCAIHAWMQGRLRSR